MSISMHLLLSFSDTLPCKHLGSGPNSAAFSAGGTLCKRPTSLHVVVFVLAYELGIKLGFVLRRKITKFTKNTYNKGSVILNYYLLLTLFLGKLTIFSQLKCNLHTAMCPDLRTRPHALQHSGIHLSKHFQDTPSTSACSHTPVSISSSLLTETPCGEGSGRKTNL